MLFENISRERERRDNIYEGDGAEEDITYYVSPNIQVGLWGFEDQGEDLSSFTITRIRKLLTPSTPALPPPPPPSSPTSSLSASLPAAGGRSRRRTRRTRRYNG